jgi:pSer/pThr/pTyr-binding forkhead associated (FHA) protein
MAKLIVESGGDRREFALTDPCRIGRDADSDVPLSDAGASRRHCRLFRDADGWVVEDLNSANGTYKNEARIDRARLADGDVLRIGATTLTLSLKAVAAPDEILLEDPADGAPLVLIGVAGELSGRRIDVQPPRLTVGRKASNHVVVGDGKVSGVHCEIAFEAGRPVLRDLGSTNGTFLEGKRIDEIALSHGDRVGIGESILVVAERGQPEPMLQREEGIGEQTIIAGPELRVVGAAEAARRAGGGSGALALLGLLLLVGGSAAGGWYWYDQKQRQEATAAAPPASSNLLGDRWSFESTDEVPSPLTAWNFGGGDSFSIGGNAAASGAQGLSTRLSGAGATAELADPIAITGGGARFAVRAKARVSGNGRARLAIRFGRLDDASYHLEQVVAAGSDATFTGLGGEVVAPSGADRVQVVLVAAGNDGEVAFDDVELELLRAEKPAITAVGAFELESFGMARQVRRNAETLLRIQPPIARDPEGVAFEAGRFAAGDRLFVGGGNEVALALTTSSDAKTASYGLTAEYDAARVASVVVPIELRGPLLDHDVALLSDRGLEPFRDGFEVDGVTTLVAGKGPTRLRLRFDPPIELRGKRQDTVFAIEAVLAAASPRLSIVAQADFQAEKVDAAKAAAEAERTYAAGDLGGTLTQARAIATTYPFDESALAAAETLRQKAERDADQLRRETAAAVERAKYLKSDAVYRAAEAQLAAAASRLEGLDLAATLRAQAAELATERQARLAEREAARARLLVERIRTALAQSPPRKLVAAVIADHLATRFAGSEEARVAQELTKGAQ